MDIGPDGLLYFTGGTDSRAYRVDKDGNAEMFVEIIDGAGFTLGCQFDDEGNYYMVNGRGVYMVTGDDINDKSLPLPIVPELFFEWPEALAIPMSIDVDNNSGMAYVSDMGNGNIWIIDTESGVGEKWVSSSEPGYELLFGEADSTNFLGVPFGVVEVMVDKNSDWLYFSNHELNYFGRVKILADGSPGELQVLDTVLNRAALNGAFLDTRNNKLYGATPFLNFHNGVAREPVATRGGEIWMIDLDDIDENGEGGKAELVVQDLELGTVTDIITGYGFGEESDIYLLDGSFDTLVWPTGVLPDPDAPYHGAVRKVKRTTVSKTKKGKAGKKSSKKQKGETASSGYQFQNDGPLLEISLDEFGEVHPAKMDIGPDGLLYFTGGTDSRAYRVDKDGNAEMFVEIIDGAGFTLGCQFDDEGNYYMVNGRGVYMVTGDDINDKSLPLPIVPELFFEWPEALAIPMSIDVDNNSGMAYVSDMGNGNIWIIDTESGVGEKWVSSSEPGYELLFGEADSTNFLGVPFGVVEVMVDKNSDWLYFSNHELNYFGRVKILADGSPGELQVLDTVLNRAALNGAFLDTRNNKLYGATPFLNFHNGVAREPVATRGGEIWMIDLDDIDENGEGGKAELVVQDLELGTVTDIITGYGFGEESDIYLLDGSFDTLVWPTGVLPDPDAPYHGAVRKVKRTKVLKGN